MFTVGFLNTDICISSPCVATDCSIKKFTTSVSPIPIIIPKYPKMAVIIRDSKIILDNIEEGGAPIALRIPISLVRSFTDTNIMLLTPTIPAISVSKPMIETKMVIPPNIFCVSM